MNLRPLSLLMSLFLTSGLYAAPTLTTPEPTPTSTKNQQASYALGVIMGQQTNAFHVDLDMSYFIQGVQDKLAGGALQMSAAEIQSAIEQAKLQAKSKGLKEKLQELKGGGNTTSYVTIPAEKGLPERQVPITYTHTSSTPSPSPSPSPQELANSKAFLQQHATLPGVITINDTTQYTVLKKGDGNTPTDNATVTISLSKIEKLTNGKLVSTNTNAQTKEVPLQRIKNSNNPIFDIITRMSTGSKWNITSLDLNTNQVSSVTITLEKITAPETEKSSQGEQ